MHIFLISIWVTSFVAISLAIPIANKDGNDLLDQYKRGISKCTICNDVVAELHKEIGTKRGRELSDELLGFMCELIRVEDWLVCKDIGQEYGDIFEFIVSQLIINPDEVCPRIFEDCGKPGRFDPFYNWTVSLPNTPKPPVQKLVAPPAGSQTMRVLHLSDIHYDFSYSPGSEVQCEDPLCCRENTTRKDPNKVNEPAGYWGTPKNCDIPYWTADAILNKIVEQEKYDIVYWTGDLVPHNVWHQSKEYQAMYYRNMTALFRKYFSHKPFFAAIGNHEAAPVDSFPPVSWSALPERYSNQWVYNEMNTSWRLWLPEKTSANIVSKGSYSLQVMDNLRVISLNTNYKDNINFWMLLNQTDPDGVLAWLAEQLQDAENAGDKVHIIAHEPPTATGIYWSWFYNYYQIINRYESTIRGQFMGHEHWDSFRLFFADSDPSTRATNVAWASSSITTWSNHMPSYRVYTVDARPNGTWGVLDFETKIFNITEANKNTDQFVSPYVEYKASEAYGIKTAFPDDMYKLVADMSSEEGHKYLKSYIKYKFISSDKKCDGICELEQLCDIRSTKPLSPELCLKPMKRH